MATARRSDYPDLQNKTALITGGSGELGRALALSFAAVGSNLILFTRSNGIDLNHLTDNLRAKFNIKTEIIESDFTDLDHLISTLENILKYKSVDVLINNAGINSGIPAMDIASKDFIDTAKINMVAPCIFMQKIGNKMISKKNNGSIINISSIKGMEASSDAAYGSTKAGLIQMTKTFANLLAPNVRVNAIAPGVLVGKHADKMSDAKKNRYLCQTALGRLGSYSEVSEVALFLASNKSSYMTGSIINCDGGYVL